MFTRRWTFRASEYTVDHGLAGIAWDRPGFREALAACRTGFRFVGPTTVYAAMQALGVVNGNLEGCFVRRAVDEERATLVRPALTRRLSTHVP